MVRKYKREVPRRALLLHAAELVDGVVRLGLVLAQSTLEPIALSVGRLETVVAGPTDGAILARAWDQDVATLAAVYQVVAVAAGDTVWPCVPESEQRFWVHVH